MLCERPGFSVVCPNVRTYHDIEVRQYWEAHKLRPQFPIGLTDFVDGGCNG